MTTPRPHRLFHKEFGTPNRVFPKIFESQKYGQGTHDWAMYLMDLLAMRRVEHTTVINPPPSPQDGQVWFLTGTPTGAWTGHANQFAHWTARFNAWNFILPQEGDLFWSKGENILWIWTGTAPIKEIKQV